MMLAWSARLDLVNPPCVVPVSRAMPRAAVLLSLCLASACSPRLYLRHETPPALDSQNITSVRVQGVTPQTGPNVLATLIDPLSGLAAAVLEPEVVRMLERELSQSCAMLVQACPGGACPPVEGTLLVQLQSVQANGGVAPTPKSSGEALSVTTNALFTLVRPDNATVFRQSYFGRRSGPTPQVSKDGSNNFAEALLTVQNAARLTQEALLNMVSAFVTDLRPGAATDVLILENPEPLKPAVQAALDGNTDASVQLHRAWLATHPNDAYAWGNLGAVLSVRAEFEAAIDAYDRASQLKPGDYADDAALARTRLAEVNQLKALRRPACGR
jgi:hypothetical protein